MEIVRTSPTLDNLISRADNIAANSCDFLVKDAACHAKVVGKMLEYFETSGTSRYVPMRDYAMSQLCVKLGIPYRYVEKCFEAEMGWLAEQNMNEWLSRFSKDLFIRESYGQIRGILSPRYSVFDSDKVLDIVSNTSGIEDYDIKGSVLNEERLHVRFVAKNMLPIPDEDLFPGFILDSSDVGRSSLSLKFFVWKQVCTNGMVVPKKVGTLCRRVHFSITEAEFVSELKEALALIPSLTRGVTESIKDTIATPIGALSTEEDITKMIESLKRTTIDETGARKVIDLLNDGTYSHNRWGLINAVTEVAQNYDLEKRLQIEAGAGMLLAA